MDHTAMHANPPGTAPSGSAHERYLRAVSEMQRALCRSTSADLRHLGHVLAPLGIATEVSRVYLFENHRDDAGHLLMSQRAEWCARGIEPEIDNPDLQSLPYDAFFPRWEPELSSGRAIRNLTKDMPREERTLLEAQGIVSILVVPLVVQDTFVGFIGFDDCVTERIWSALEIDLLSAAATNIGLFLDQRRVRVDLERSNAALVEARDTALAAMNARSTFLAKVSHELRTPLNAILGYSEIVRDALEDGDLHDAPNDLNRILRSGRHLLDMVDDLLTLTQLGSGKSKVTLGRVDLETWLDSMQELWFHPTADHPGPIVEIERGPDLGTVMTDPSRLTQIVLNLLSNATKFTTPEGRVVLTIRGDPVAVTLAVTDTGIGIGPQQLPNIFEEFYQADSSCTGEGRGVGLGLPIVKRLCDSLGATIVVTSTLGVGSRFHVTVPRGHAT